MDLHHGVVAHQQRIQLGRHRVGIGGAALWLRLQKKFNNRAEQEGTIM